VEDAVSAQFAVDIPAFATPTLAGAVRRAEVLARAEADALIAACWPTAQRAAAWCLRRPLAAVLASAGEACMADSSAGLFPLRWRSVTADQAAGRSRQALAGFKC